MSDERRSRDLELLKNAVDRDRKKKPSGGDKRGRSSSSEILYRGQPVAGRGGSGGRAPGAPGGGGGQKPSSSGGGADVKDALRKLTQLFNDGLITTAEYDAKRAEILDRL